MYHCECKLYLATENKLLEQVISSADSPNDSTYQIIKWQSGKEASGTISYGYDAALIADGNTAAKVLQSDIPSYVYTVLLTDASSLGDLSPDMYDYFDDIWVGGTKALIQSHYKRLQNTLKLRFDNRRLDICLTTATDSIPDLVWFKDTAGAHWKVNTGFCKAVAKSKEQIYKKGHYYIWDMPEQEYKKGDYVCLESEEIVMDARETVLFDEKVKTKSGMRLFKTYKSPLIDPDGSIFGTCGVAHDVTELQNINTELEIVMESMPFSVLVEDTESRIISVNSKFHEFFPHCTVTPGEKSDVWKQYAVKTVNTPDGGTEILVRTEDDTMRHLEKHDAPIIDVFNEVIGSILIFDDITAERNLEQQTRQSANTDFLTGLHNRRSLFEYIETLVDAPQINITTVDLDHFKHVNDTFGHHAGDVAITLAANKLQEIYSDDFVARLGGDEFIVISDRELSEQQVKELTDYSLHTLNQAFLQDKRFAGVTASLGVAVQQITPDETQDVEALMRVSDSSLYDAKNSGRSCYRIAYKKQGSDKS